MHLFYTSQKFSIYLTVYVHFSTPDKSFQLT